MNFFPFLLLNININGVCCSPPAPPVKCDTSGCTVSNAYGIFPDRLTCRATPAVFPSSEEELLAAVAASSRNKQKMRVVTQWSQSIPKLVCLGGEEGLIISTQELKHVVSIDEESMRMSVESGAALGDIISAATEYKLALPQTPYWKGLTIGGILCMGAHGSSVFGKGSVVHEYVVGMRLVVPLRGGNASVVTLNSSHADLDVAKLSLGLLGVISQACP
ncbi:L-gulonolactone oxidase 2-like [Cryptomeria japonica]|uniref:L-gulonolactone oxidase 2-like n=1 Tax=Cryptomeria japonica TaxID=3369 RepID=UPI0025AC9534|nr:L-gulonolactone oxidase 2-like [Cryptomeria japonica]